MKLKLSAHITSLGCPKNFVDTEIIAASLLKSQIGIESSPDLANIMIINTCAFISSARNESAEHLRNAIKWKKEKPGRIIVLCGCINQYKDAKEIKDIISEVDIRLSPDDVENAGKIIINHLDGKKLEKYFLSEAIYLPKSSTPRLQLTPQHYAYVKIADGCSNFCSYCSIPHIRGKFRSRTIEDITTECKNLIMNGCREIILIAQDSGNYGSDIYQKPMIVELLRSVDSIKTEEKFWIRLMYCHPAHFPNDLIFMFKDLEHLLPYIDLPLQHISDRILTLMNRKTSSAQIRNLLDKIRSLPEKIALRTTFITGFPGETDDDFSTLIKFIEEQKFDRLGAFSYSPEPNTKAFKMKNKISQQIAQERLETIMKIQKKISLKNNKELIGKTVEVIVDKIISNSKAIGRTQFDAPGIDNTATIIKHKISEGCIVQAVVKSASAYSVNVE